MHLLDVFFAWPAGGIWSNLIASAIWAAPAGALAVWRMRVHLARHRDELHARHDAHEQALAALHAKVDAIQRRAPIGSLPDGTPVHIDGQRLWQEIQRQRLRNGPGFGGPRV